MVFVAVLIHFVSTKTRIGRYLRVVGSNQAAARLSGIKVNRVNWFAYTFATSRACWQPFPGSCSRLAWGSHPAGRLDMR